MCALVAVHRRRPSCEGVYRNPGPRSTFRNGGKHAGRHSRPGGLVDVTGAFPPVACLPLAIACLSHANEHPVQTAHKVDGVILLRQARRDHLINRTDKLSSCFLFQNVCVFIHTYTHTHTHKRRGRFEIASRHLGICRHFLRSRNIDPANYSAWLDENKSGPRVFFVFFFFVVVFFSPL